jgi:hypothetical protein
MGKRLQSHKSRPLVFGFLERISSEAFEEFPRQVTELIGKEHGVYALYKGNHLYYVGLATNLRNRIKNHLKDRHASKWDRFSLYLVRKADHIKELESLILRIASPKGNVKEGHLKRAQNLRKLLDGLIRTDQEDMRENILGSKHVAKVLTRPRSRTTDKRQPTLAPFVKHRFHIRFRYKEKLYVAHVRADGSIMFASEGAQPKGLIGKVFTSPSAAASAVTRLPADGWRVWTFQDHKGNWVLLDELRKNRG